jgi:hypothetical protein
MRIPNDARCAASGNRRRKRPLCFPRWTAWSLLAVSAATTGCGDEGLERRAVEGTVSVGETPLKEGSIVFVPAKGTEGPKAAGRVVDGRFKIRRREGPVVGTHKVEVYADEPAAFDMDDPLQYAQNAPRSGPENSVAEAYNTKTVLEATISAEKRNQFEFLVQTRK